MKWDWKTIVILTGTVVILVFGVLNVVSGNHLVGAVLLACIVLSLPRVMRYTRKDAPSQPARLQPPEAANTPETDAPGGSE